MTDIMIAGGGIGGLTAALALQRTGLTVRVFEQTAQFADVGAGISLSPSASRGLFSLGLREAIERDADIPSRAGTANYKTGQATSSGQVTAMKQGSGGLPIFYQIHRADLHALLLNAVLAHDPQAVLVGKSLTSFVQHKGQVTATFTDGATASAPFLIGADGVNSRVRAELFGAEAARFTGQVAYRFLVPMDLAKPFMGLGPSVHYVGPGRGLLRYQIRHGAFVNAVAFVRTETWTGEGWSTPFEPEELIGLFDGWHEDVLGLIGQAPRASARKWALFDRNPLPHWSVGQVSLLGDAAHPMLPFLGLGAATSIEDAVILGRALQASQTPAEGLRRYEATRVDRAAKILLGSRRQGQLQQSTDVGEALKPAPADDVDLYSYDPTQAELPPSARVVGLKSPQEAHCADWAPGEPPAAAGCCRPILRSKVGCTPRSAGPQWPLKKWEVRMSVAPETATVPQLTFSKIVVRDLDPLVSFYRDVFGLRESGYIQGDDFEEKMMRSKGGFTLVIYRYKDGREITLGNAYGPLGFVVPNVEDLYSRAIEGGATSSRPPGMFGERPIAFVFDPEGREIELIES